MTASKISTLAIKWPFGITFLLSLGFFVVGLSAVEIGARSKIFHEIFTAPSWGTRHRQLEIQLFRLEEYADKNDGVDCIVVGNSMVWRGFNPSEFQASVKNQSGINLTCFNFGVDALTGVNAGVLTKILIEKYQPKTLIFGPDARDFTVSLDHKDTTVLSSMPWLKYHNGQFNLEGWLIEHAYIYRYRFIIRDLLNFGYVTPFQKNTNQLQLATLSFDVDPSVFQIIENIPEPDTDDGHAGCFHPGSNRLGSILYGCSHYF